jgi:hypothetical protein
MQMQIYIRFKYKVISGFRILSGRRFSGINRHLCLKNGQKRRVARALDGGRIPFFFIVKRNRYALPLACSGAAALGGTFCKSATHGRIRVVRQGDRAAMARPGGVAPAGARRICARYRSGRKAQPQDLRADLTGPETCSGQGAMRRAQFSARTVLRKARVRSSCGSVKSSSGGPDSQIWP